MLSSKSQRVASVLTIAKRFGSSYTWIPKNKANADEKYKQVYHRYFDQQLPGLDQYTSTDGYLDKYMITPGTPDTRTVSYLTMCSTKAMYAGLARATIGKCIAHMNASADVLALASIDVDLSKFAEGTCATLKWRGKPVFVKHRTPEEIAAAKADDSAELRDNQKDSERVKYDKWLIVLGVCTHLGCVPIPNAGEFTGGFFCPCHGSHYDASGRIRLGPAPLNLEVPSHTFENENTVIIG